MTEKISELMPEIAIIREIMQHADAEYDMRERAALRLQTETLRAENERLIDYYEQQGCDATIKENARLRAEVKRLNAPMEATFQWATLAENKSLRSEVERLRHHPYGQIINERDVEIVTLRAEIEALRAALECIATYDKATGLDVCGIARAALQSKGE